MLVPILVAALGAILFFGMLAYALSRPSPGKSKTRRLAAVKDRYATNAEAAAMAQMRKAILSTSAKGGGIGDMLPKRDQLQMRLRRTGKSWTLNQYAMASGGMFVALGLIMILLRMPFIMALAVALPLTLFIPYFVVNVLINKRIAKFNTKFPDAIDLLVRGLKSGLPITETLAVVGQEVPGPVGEEFKGIVERIRIGRTMDAALQETADLLGTPEFQFFCITIAIQRETGGNLAETLANLSDVLRKRAQMKLKIRAMSSEAKASAYIVGSLPFFVFGLVYYMSPNYLKGFFSDPTLIYTGLGGLVWMGIGVAIMAKMIRFEI